MTVPEAYAAAVSALPDLQQVLKLQRPAMAGQPFPMKDGSITDAPKGVGNPWKGACSNHGFWYKLREGDMRMFEKLVAYTHEQDKFLMRYELLDELKTVHSGDVDFLVAANQRGDLIGGIVRGGGTIVAHAVREEYRHSGIGSILLKEVLARCSEKDLEITLDKSLYRSIEKFGGFKPVAGSSLVHVTITNPTGLATLETPGYRTISDIDWAAVGGLLSGSGVSIDAVKLWSAAGQLTAVGDEKGAVKALVRVSEAAGGYVKRLVVGPLVAAAADAARAVLHAALHPLYNDSTDYAWNPDVHSLQRRTLHFRVPKGNSELLTALENFSGNGQFEKSRLEFQKFATGKVQGTSKIHAEVINY